MSTRNIFGNTQAFKRLNNGTVPPTLSPTFLRGQTPIPSATPKAPWYRNPSWLPLPTVAPGETRIVGVYAVVPGKTYYQLVIQTGNFTIDWGDGVTESFSGSTTPRGHVYDFENPLLAGTNAPVTFQDTGDTVTRNNHGYTNGMTISFAEITSTTGISVNTLYYVVGATTNTFQVSLTLGGAALPLTTDGTGVILPYKQAIISITQSTNINTITLADTNFTTLAGFSHPMSVNYLDLILAVPLANSVLIKATNARYPYLEQIDVRVGMPSTTSLLSNNSTLDPLFPVLANVVQFVAPNTTTVQSLFQNLACLQSVGTLSLPNCTNFTTLFDNCPTLQTAPVFTTSTAALNLTNMFLNCQSLASFADLSFTRWATNMSNTFRGCVSLEEVPLLDTANVTLMSGMFNGCRSLRTVAALNTANVTDMNTMFNNCASLTQVPLFNTANVTFMNSMFVGCSGLQEVPLFNTAKVISMSLMFSGCYSLTQVPLFNTALVTNMSSMFQNCYSLTQVPLFNTANVTNVSAMFQNCYSLTQVPLFNTANVTTMGSMFQYCYSLKEALSFNTGNVTNTSSMFQYCYSLIRAPRLLVLPKATSIASMFSGCLSLQYAPEVIQVGSPSARVVSFSGSNLFNTCTSLTKVLSDITIYTTGALDLSSMCNGASSLQETPTLTLDSTNGSLTLSQLFANCTALETVNPINISSGGTTGSMSQMFFVCSALKKVPLFNTQSIANMSNMFANCSTLSEVPPFNTANVTDMSSMFTNCFSLRSTPAFSLPKITTFLNTFNNCFGLTEVGALNNTTTTLTNTSNMFQNCRALRRAPLFNTQNVTNVSAMFAQCNNLIEIPAYDLTSATTTSSFCDSVNSLQSFKATNLRRDLFLGSGLLSVEGLNELFNAMPSLIGTAAANLNIASNPGVLPGISKSGITATAGSKVITLTNTSSIQVGMAALQTTSLGGRPITFTGNPSNLVNLTNHQLPSGTKVAFRTITTTTGITTNIIYYVVNPTADSFQVSATLGGPPLTLTNNGTGEAKWESYVESINPNVSVTLTVPVTGPGASVQYQFRQANINIPSLKRWSISF